MIQIRNLSKIINGRTILDVGDITVNPGEIAAIVGPADSGLDILLEILLGKASPSSGEITLEDKSPTKDQKDLDKKIGVLFQDDGLYPYLSVEKNLQFFARLYGLSNRRVSEILETICLADQPKGKVNQLPSGLARRLAIGRTLLHRPSILILAYPFARCDEDSLNLIKHLIHQEAENGNTILILDEDTANLGNLCSRIYFLRQGRIEKILEGDEPQPSNLPFKIPVKLEGKVALLNPSDILYAEASEGHTLLITRDGELDSQYTLQELEERLKRSGFFRAHRSFLVNLQHVQEVIPYSKNSFSLRLNDKDHTEIPLSKNSASELRDMLDY
jgi:ABC-2 type transport system ATP-binding protein